MTFNGIGLGAASGMQDVHPQLGPVRYQVHNIGWEPDGQVGQTINVMRRVVAEDFAHPEFVSRVKGVIGNPGLGAMTDSEKVQRIWEHTKSNIRFQRDELTGLRADGLGIGGVDPDEVVETIIRPRDMASYMDQGIAVGDCDDFSMYEAAMLTAAGIPCAFCTVAADGNAPGQFSHVYVVAYPRDENAGRLPCDASHGEYCGWEVPNRYGKLEEWPVMDKARWWIGNLVTGVVVSAGLWYGWKFVQRELGI